MRPAMEGVLGILLLLSVVQVFAAVYEYWVVGPFGLGFKSIPLKPQAQNPKTKNLKLQNRKPSTVKTS